MPRRDRLEVRERTAYDGAEVEPLDEADVATRRRAGAGARLGGGGRRLPAQLRRPRPRAAACARRSRRRCRTRTSSRSADILPEEQEFERTATTVANAYLGPIFRGYVDRLGDALQAEGFGGTVFVMHSGGGLLAGAVDGAPARAHGDVGPGGRRHRGRGDRRGGRRGATC